MQQNVNEYLIFNAESKDCFWTKKIFISSSKVLYNLKKQQQQNNYCWCSQVREEILKILLYSGYSNFLLHSHPSCAAMTVTAMTALFPFSLYLVAIIYFTHVCVSVTNLCIQANTGTQPCRDSSLCCNQWPKQAKWDTWTFSKALQYTKELMASHIRVPFIGDVDILFYFSLSIKRELIYLGIINIIKDLCHQEIFTCEVPLQTCCAPHPSINWQSVNVIQHKCLPTCMFLPA